MSFPIDKDDGAGFGDKVLCCPKCGKPITVPLFTNPEKILCECGEWIILRSSCWMNNGKVHKENSQTLCTLPVDKR